MQSTNGIEDQTFESELKALQELDQEIGRLKFQLDQVRDLEKELTSAKNSFRITEESIILARTILERILKNKQFFENVLTQALSDSMDSDIQFILQETSDDEGPVKGLKILVKDGNGNPRNPVGQEGRSLGDIINLFTSLVMIILIPGTVRFLVVDEILSHASTSVQENTNELLEELCKKTGTQLIQITHSPRTVGRVLKIEKLANKSTGEIYSTVSEVK